MTYIRLRNKRNQKRNNQMVKARHQTERKNSNKWAHHGIARGFLVAKEDTPICWTRETELSVKQ